MRIMADVERKKLTELRVIDLKTELERRGLDKTGNKAALLDRLSKSIADEGENPDEYLIIPCGGVCKISPRKNSVTGASNQDESPETLESQKEETTEGPDNNESKVKVEKPIVEKETMAIKTEELQSEVQNNTSKETDCKQEPKVHLTKLASESTQAVKAEPEAAVAASQTSSNSASTLEANGIDNEDSINLTIGEDEENLLAEETESHDRHKDGGEKKKLEENKKGESKGSSRAEAGANSKEGTTSGANVGTKNKQDGGDGSKSVESSNKSQKRDDKDKKTSQVSPVNASSRNLWVSGLSSGTRATDLKQIFSKYGKVIGAKVVTNARTPGARCYGYVTMSTSEDAAKCIQHLHRTELHGRVIFVEKAKGDTQQSHMRKRDTTNGKSEKKEEKDKAKDNHDLNDRKEKEQKKEIEDKGSETMKKLDEKSEGPENKKAEVMEKKDEAAKESDTRSTKSTSKKPEGEKGKRDEKRIRSWDHHRSHTRSRSRERRRRDDVLTFAKIREERERQRLRERERMLREEERRRREDMERQREIERRQREEAARLEREREKLRRERERIEQEKAELLRLERERQKLEREKLERERLELKRQQMRLEESRRAPPPPSIKRSSSDRRDPRDLYVEPDRKRMTTEHSRRHTPERVSDRRGEILDRVSDRRLDASPPTRYESSRSAQDIGIKKEFKRSSEFTSRSSRPESFTEVSRGREVIVRREPLSAAASSIDPRQVKERYERPSTTTYTREREVRRSEPETHRSSRDSHTRYGESFKPTSSSTPRDSRYVESNRTTSSWHSGPPSAKSFNSVPSSGTRDPRNEPSSWSSRSSENVNRWSNSSSMGNTLRHPVPPTYQSGPIQSMGLTAPGTTPSYDRFDPYKSSMASMRKY
ncbi:SAFB-like transcription modulator isoform X2 [Hylaeus anthracinus]|uniref:SAFB-like transcription modulator isoform X2 n=1 Tax=Hylaeus volcanicus TaxID=313075 RepID=UPI0023B823C7|nr:SAFB-like transcription modulator isoform X2 [Hylaeus volcanicus]XP_054003578.1 SAFB-like transcription modulator isoform X2 [Hylaeus anthracinus]